MVKIKNDNKFKVNDKVWWFDAWGNLSHGVILSIQDGEVAANGEPVAHIGADDGTRTGAKLCDCWPTKEECLDAEKRRSELQKEEYKESIGTVEDLVKFLFNHDVRSEFRDYDAAAAAKERAKELLNINITE